MANSNSLAGLGIGAIACLVVVGVFGLPSILGTLASVGVLACAIWMVSISAHNPPN